MILISKKTVESLITDLVNGSADPLYVSRPTRQPDDSGTPVAWFRLIRLRINSAPRNLATTHPDTATFEAMFAVFVPAAVGNDNVYALAIAENAVLALLYGQRLATTSDGTYEGVVNRYELDDQVEPADGEDGVNRHVQMGVVTVGGVIARTV